MFLSKVERQKLDLERARSRNKYFQSKCALLEAECKVLADRLINSQIFRAEENETLIMLKKTISDVEHAVDQKNDELNRTEQHLNSLLELEGLEQSANNSLDSSNHDDMTMLVTDEVLQIKDDMIKCLQEELIEVRLNQAEQCAQLQEMRNTERELCADVQKLTDEEPETVARLQEELMRHKVQEIEVLGQFQTMKEMLAAMKHELEGQIKNQESDTTDNKKKSDGTVKINKGKAIWNSLDKTKRKECKHEKHIKHLEEEQNELYGKIEDLQKVIEIQNKQAQFKEEEKRRLSESLKNVRIRTESTEKMIVERARQYQQLESTAHQKLVSIMQSIGQKDAKIEKLTKDVEKIAKRRNSHLLQKSVVTEASTVEELERTAENLKERINILHSEIATKKHEKSQDR